MTNKEALKILHPDTTIEALVEVEYFAGLKGQSAKIAIVTEACIHACSVLQDAIDRENGCEHCRANKCKICDSTILKCSKCTNHNKFISVPFCSRCGRKLNGDCTI